MGYPNFKEERKLHKRNFKFVAGLDEAGRGALAGPVVACVVIISKSKSNYFTKLKINDSKKVSPKKREELYKILTNHNQIKFAIGKASEKIIDRINILEATKLAMIKAIKNLTTMPDFLILDGNIKLDLNISQKAIVKGDEKVLSCAAASIIAKVTRDRIMKRYDKKYSKYGFARHKGYGTKFHKEMLRKHKYCKIHRKSFNFNAKILPLKSWSVFYFLLRYLIFINNYFLRMRYEKSLNNWRWRVNKRHLFN